MTRELAPFSMAEYLAATASNHPHLRGLPVVAPYSFPRLLSASPASPRSSVGNGPPPTLVVYALATPTTSVMAVGGTPLPMAAAAATVLDEVV